MGRMGAQNIGMIYHVAQDQYFQLGQIYLDCTVRLGFPFLVLRLIEFRLCDSHLACWFHMSVFVVVAYAFL